ncbi:class I SAM-dependent methyltransferase [Thalassobaculum litoreum]|uniref:2-polyprenyl-3-methyl-5-hydroxy-6-metoxy-1,4-benzoquinol methylase n=1 Tax=Thalassobaculum litoreum DSM 18839 TaxID=1123362 RepID=A0A8G2BK40_9PROT|nr:class I SAM-dependent methyltransferase [Thalassobaculum litoreum]SDF83578.1 2-polyprenyl-3-methyl-5-hydroxy-6-metoxy-1,4-benzoquinol methylase [Thalassobaculum litoreum DSM 18839]
MDLISSCLCAATTFRDFERNGLRVRECQSCGALHQHVEMSLDQYADWYRRQYHDGHYTHSFAHDRNVARKRLDAYRIPAGARLLDVGCANGAFVVEACERGLDAFGQDLADDASMVPERTYSAALEAIHFPADHFDVVTIHDVLEHVPDPVKFLLEVRRILKQGGRLLLDFPAFEEPEGRHHWKEVEHLWLLGIDALVELLSATGFTCEAAGHPIPGKWLLDCRAPRESRTTVILPPGIGDCYWSLVKLQGLMAARGWGAVVDVWVEEARDRNRAADFVRLAPFVSYQGTVSQTGSRPAFHEAYRTDGRAVIPNVCGRDYLVAFNGALGAGRSLSDVEPDAKADWRYPMFRSLAQVEAEREYRERFGEYVVAFFVDGGFYHKWTAHFGRDEIRKLFETLSADRTVVVMGAGWDQGGISSRAGGPVVDLSGKTNIDQMLGLLRGASGIVGFPAGNTIVGAALGTPTVMLYHNHFDRRFWLNTVPPSVVGSSYAALDVSKVGVPDVVKALDAMLAVRCAA